MAIKAIIFDFGGVLMRTEAQTGRREWEERLGLPTGELERVVHQSDVWIRCQHGEVTPEQYWQEVATRLGITAEALPDLRRDYFRDDRLDPSLIQLIRNLRKVGYKLGLLSNDSLLLETRLRDELMIYDLFDVVVISAQIGMMKPKPGAYLAIAERLNVAPEECIFVDDVISNIDGAAAVGMSGIHFKPTLDLSAALRTMGVTIS